MMWYSGWRDGYMGCTARYSDPDYMKGYRIGATERQQDKESA